MTRGIVAALTVLGAALTIAGLAWGARKLLAERKELTWRLDEVDRIGRDDSLSGEEKKAAQQAILPVISTWDDVQYIRQWIRRFILEQATSGLGWPAAFTAVGVLLSTTAGVWALYV